MFKGLLIAYAIGSFGQSLAFNSKGLTKCVPLNNRPCQNRRTVINTNSVKTLFYPLYDSMVEVLTLLMTHMLKFVFQI